MPGLDQDVDAIILEEGLDNTQSATEEPTQTPTDTPTPDEPPKPEEPAPEPQQPADPEKETEAPEPKPEEPAKPVEPDNSKSEAVAEAKSFIENLKLTQEQVFNQDGTAKPFEEVVKPGEYLLSQLEPVKVTDKDGNVHEFLLLDDVKEKFPDGFEAKNNIEQMQFERAINNNENKFQDAINTYRNAKEAYTSETSQIAEARTTQTQLRSEYTAMADAGLVPKVDVDPKDPKFNESAAVKELDKILGFMQTENEKLAEKGLGQITSLYVAKQLMDNQAAAAKTDEQKQQIVNERKEVASLTSSPTPDTPTTAKNLTNVPMSRLADEIIAQEGLK